MRVGSASRDAMASWAVSAMITQRWRAHLKEGPVPVLRGDPQVPTRRLAPRRCRAQHSVRGRCSWLGVPPRVNPACAARLPVTRDESRLSWLTVCVHTSG